MLSINNGFELHYNNSLKNINGLTSVTDMPGNLLIWNNEQLSDFCGLKTTANNNGFGDFFSITGNLYNPTQEEIKTENCSQ